MLRVSTTEVLIGFCFTDQSFLVCVCVCPPPAVCAKEAVSKGLAGLPVDKSATLAVMFGGGPGCGKSRELEELPFVLRTHGANMSAECVSLTETSLLMTALFSRGNHVQLRTVVNSTQLLLSEEMHMDGGAIAAARALYSYFSTGMSYIDFFGKLRPAASQLNFTSAVSMIAEHRHVAALGANQCPLFITYAIDEAQNILVPPGGTGHKAAYP